MYIIKRDKAFVCIQESCCSGSVSPTSLAFIGHHAGKDISCARLLPDIVSYVVIPTLLSSISGSDMFRPFTCFTLVEITCFSRTACAFLNVTTFFWGISRLLPAPETLLPYSAVLPGNLFVTDVSIPDSSAAREAECQ